MFCEPWELHKSIRPFSYIVLQLQVHDWGEAIKPSTESNRECLPWFPWTWGEITFSLLDIFQLFLRIVKDDPASVVSNQGI